MNLRQRAFNGLMWSALEKWGDKLLTLLVFLLLARLLQPEAFGLVALASVYIVFMQVFVEQGFVDAIIQRREIEDAHLNTAFWTNIVLGVVFALASVAGAGLIASLFKEPELEPLIRWLSLGFVLNGLNGVQLAVYRRRLAFRVLAVRTIIASAAGGMVGVGMALDGMGAWSLVGQQLTRNAVSVAVLWKASGWRPGFGFSARHFKDLFSFGINMVGVNMLNFLSSRSDALLIGYFLGPVALGYYTVAHKILKTLTDLLTSVSAQVTFPVFSRIQNERERLLRAFYTATRYTSLIGFPMFMGLAAMAPEVIPLIFGPQWQPSVPIMQILAFIGLLYSVTYFNGGLFMAIGRPAVRLALTLINTLANLAALAIGIRWGIVGVAFAFMIRGYITMPLTPLVLRKLIGLNIGVYLRQFAVPLAGSLSLAAAVTALRYTVHIPPYVLLALEVTLAIAVYLAFLRVVEPSIFQQALSVARSLRVSQA